MKVETKYDIGDIVKFNKVITYPGKRNNTEREIHVGIIKKVLLSKSGISYLMQSSYQDWVVEAEIIALLEKG